MSDKYFIVQFIRRCVNCRCPLSVLIHHCFFVFCFLITQQNNMVKIGAMFALPLLYCVNWSWILFLFVNSKISKHDNFYSAVIQFVNDASSDEDYSLRLSVVNFELNEVTSQINKLVGIMNTVHLTPFDWTSMAHKHWMDTFLWRVYPELRSELTHWKHLRFSDGWNFVGSSLRVAFLALFVYVLQPIYAIIVCYSCLHPLICYVSIFIDPPPLKKDSTETLDLSIFMHLSSIIYAVCILALMFYARGAFKFAKTLFYIVAASDKLESSTDTVYTEEEV